MKKILQVHNYYDIRGGEDAVVEAEHELLSKKNSVITCYESNANIKSVWQKVITAFNVSFSKSSKKKLLKIIAANKSEIVHVHNFFPKLTPSVFQATYETDAASILTLHNFRTICPLSLIHISEPTRPY